MFQQNYAPELVAIDNGYGDTKFKTASFMSKFRSRVMNVTDYPLNSIVIDFEGEKYKIGTGGQDDIELNKTKKQVHKLCAIAAISQAIKEGKREINLILDLPLMQYRSKEQRYEFRDYIASPGTILTFGEKYVSIKNCEVFAQGAAALYADSNKLQEYKKSLIAIVDFGSITINGLICDGMNPLSESMFTECLGVTILQDHIRTAINSKLSQNVQSYEIPYLMNDPPKNMERIIRDIEDEHFDLIIKTMRKKNWNLETLKMVGVGGGFLTTRDIARKYFDRDHLEISPNPVYANVQGLYNVGGMMFR